MRAGLTAGILPGQKEGGTSMLDPFIIENLRKQEEEKEWKPTPLTLELPLPEEKEENQKDDPSDDSKMTILSMR
jgi:hypothetical protein